MVLRIIWSDCFCVLNRKVFRIQGKHQIVRSLPVRKRSYAVSEISVYCCVVLSSSKSGIWHCTERIHLNGSEAYKKLSSFVTGEDEMIYEYLAVNFSQVSELICYISEFSDKSVNKDRYKITEQSEEAIASFKRAVPPQFSSPISHRVLN